MIPATVHGLNAMTCLSALQKCIRRSLELEAMQFAVELMSTSRAFHTMVANRLEVVCHEDLDTLAAPWIVPFVATCVEQAKRMYDPDKIGSSRMAVGNAIRAMCRSPKSRSGCHFAAAIGLRSMLEDFAPTIPDWANDQHTLAGRKLGRGLDHFRSEGAKLIPPPTADDPYIEEAYRLWALKQTAKRTDLFDAE
jgi:replication-associated recombination protein RarA